LATLSKSDRTKVSAIFFLIGIIGIVGILTYPSIPEFSNKVEIIEPVRSENVAIVNEVPRAEEPRAGEVPRAEEPRAGEVPRDEAVDPVQVSDTHPQAELLKTTIADFHKAFSSKDSKATLSYYANDRTTYAEWSGQAGAFAGTYKGYNNIRILISTILANTLDITIDMTSYDVTFSGDRATVVHQLSNTGHGQLIGEFSMNIDAVTVWEFSDGSWIIVDDRWTFMMFKTEVVAEGTVFPLDWERIGDYSVLFGNLPESYLGRP
jgi:ketosteroid isomerase-like protein|tara:strand:- start:1945 stop:2736 length:792 start_codon:yes stop_codon:yes gene_type:complete